MIHTASYYINPNTRGLTSNLKNTAVRDAEAYKESMSHLLNPVENLALAIQKPIKLAEFSSLDRQRNSINIAAGKRIAVNDGYRLTVKAQGVEVSGGNNPYDTEAYKKAEHMAGSLATLLRNACGNQRTPAYSKEEYDRWTEGVSCVMSFLGIDTSREFTVNGMKYHKDENGWFESEADGEAKAAYARQKASNRTYVFADEKAKKQTDYISNYYLATAPESVRQAWQETLQESGVNPFQIGFQSTLTTLSVEKDFETGGDDNILGSTEQSCLSAVHRILERVENPSGVVTEKRAAYLQQEKIFYTMLVSKISEHI